MHLVLPYNDRLKYNIRIRNWDGRIVKIPGDRDKDITTTIGDRVEMLIKAKQNGDPPPGFLQSWIDGMPKPLSERLLELGLLSAHRLQRSKSLETHIKEYGRIVATRKSNCAKHACQQESKVRRVCKALKIKSADQLTAAAFTSHLADQGFAVSTKRAYIIAMKDFADEMVTAKVLTENPLKDVEAPGQYEDPEYERQPLTVEQFQKLAEYLDTFERYRNQKSRWTAHDRKMIYWTAVKTAYRQSELRALVRANLHLDAEPPFISLKARHNKNKKKGQVAIPDDLAVALAKYVEGLEPTDKVFPFPTTSGSIVDMLRLDLKGAGIEWQLPTGEVIDFHAFRATAITWWLVEDGLKPKRVQILARLKSIVMVDRYTRNFKDEDFTWLNKGPKLVM